MILGPDGKPVNPPLWASLSWPGFSKILERDNQFALERKIAELRKSCGVEPEQTTIFFRRYGAGKK